jgi:hypothetical protein
MVSVIGATVMALNESSYIGRSSGSARQFRPASDLCSARTHGVSNRFISATGRLGAAGNGNDIYVYHSDLQMSGRPNIMLI